MQWRLQKLLEQSRKHPVKPKPIEGLADFKQCTALKDFEDEGKHYLVNRDRHAPAEILVFQEQTARRLVTQQKVVITQGGYCRTETVRVDVGNMLYAFFPWEEPAIAGGGGEYDQLLLRVRLRKYITVIPTINLKPGDEFFIPFKLINRIGCTLEGELTDFPAPLFLFTNQEPYEPPDAKAET